METNLQNQLPSNSKSRQATNQVEEHRTTKVISGEAGVKKKSLLRKAVEVLVKEDIRSVRDSVIDDVVIPTFADLMVNAGKRMLEMIFYGSRGRTSSNGTRDYTKSFNGGGVDRRPRNNRSVFDLDGYFVTSIEDADTAIRRMYDLLDRYEEVTVGDFFDAIGVTGNGYTDRYYGWKDLDGMSWYMRDNKYYFNMPRVRELRR